MWSDEEKLPIRHLKIVDMTVMLPGPFITALLCQYGAEVVKVEALPAGDPVRAVPDTALFELLNRGKKSVAVNLKTEEGQELVRTLAGDSDVFVENFREGVLDEMKLGYADIARENPDLLYFSIRGLSGAHASRAGHDLNFIARSGVGEWFLENGANYSTQFGDIVGGTLVPLVRLLFHLSNPNRRGMHLITHMDESFRALFLPRAFEALQGKKGMVSLLDGTRPHSRYYKCQDGEYVAFNAIQEKHWTKFCEVVEHVTWKDRQNDPDLVVELQILFSQKTARHWESLVKGDVCLFRVIPWKEHLESQVLSDPFSWCGFQANENLSKAPSLGNDTFAVLHSLGASNKEISDWVKDGIVR